MADATIQSYIEQLHELEAAAQAALLAKQQLAKSPAGPGQGAPGSTTAPAGDNSLSHPSQPMSQRVAEQAVITNFIFKGSGGGSQNLGPASGQTTAPSIADTVRDRQEILLEQNAAFGQRIRDTLRERKNDPNSSTNGEATYTDADLEAIGAEQNPFIARMQQGPYAGDRYRKFGRLGQNKKAFIKAGMDANPAQVQNPLGPLATSIPIIPGFGTPIAQAYTAHRMVEDQLWENLKQSAYGASRADWANQVATAGLNDPAVQIANRNILHNKIYGNPNALKLRDIGDIKLTSDATDAKLKFIGTGIAAIASVAFEGEERVRSLKFEKYAVERMMPGLARTKAVLAFEEHRADAIQNTVKGTLYAASAALAATGIGLPIAGLVAGATYVGGLISDKINEFYGKRYLAEAERDSGIEDLVRKYGLGDTNKPATERAKEFKDKFQTAGEFQAQLESALDDLHKGYQRVGLGDFRVNAWQDGGVGYLRRANKKMNGIAPMWYDPGRIFSMLDSSRLAVRQFASTNVARAKNRTGD